MRPVSFGGCFGWLHPTQAGIGADTAVLLCSGLANDKLTGHRPLRLLADMLASAGYPTLRFDYPGTGDSCDPVTVDDWAQWQHSIHMAIDCLRADTGARRVVLAGLRIGATLAALAAERRDDVAALVLLEPVLRGQSFIRGLATELSLAGVPPPAPDAALDLYELRLSAETVRNIAQTDLSGVRIPPPCRVAIFTAQSGPVLSNVVAHWKTGGADVICRDFAGLEPLLRPTFMNHEAGPDPTALLRWLRQAVPATPAAPGPRAALADRPLQGDGWSESPLQFGDREQLFGMLCRPAGYAQGDLAVVIVNASGDPHFGGGRLGVDLARGLARAGIASLRMDFAGIGDSLHWTAAGDTPTHVMETDRTRDMRAAVDALEALGYRRFAVQGLCSGAYHALHCGLSDARVERLLLVNLPVFEWQRGAPVEHLLVSGPSHYLRRMSEENVFTLLRRRNFDLRGPLFVLRTRLAERLYFAGLSLARRLGVKERTGFARECLELLARRPASMLFLFAPGDAGLKRFEREFGPGGMWLPWGTLSIEPGIDHSLSRSEMRGIATDHMLRFLKSGLDGARNPIEAPIMRRRETTSAAAAS